jgi:hypothetical protein
MGSRNRWTALLAAVLLLPVLGGCFLRRWVYHPVPVANAIGDSTTTLTGTRLHVFQSEHYELYGPTATSVASAAPQLNRTYREFAKHFGVEAPRMAVVLADSSFAIAPLDAGGFAQRRLHTFVYVRPHNLRDVEGVPPDLREDEIWPVGARAARELLAAFVAARRHAAPNVETATHGPDHHVDAFPIWFVDAVVALLSDPGAPDRVMSFLRDRVQEAPPLADLLAMRSPTHASSDSLVPSRERRAVVGAAGVGFTLFAIEREGPRVVGKMADAFLSGGTARDALRDTRKLPQTDRELDQAWRAWLRDAYGR